MRNSDRKYKYNNIELKREREREVFERAARDFSRGDDGRQEYIYIKKTVPNRHRRLQTRIIILITHNKTRPHNNGGGVLLRRTNIYTDAREIDKSRGHSSLSTTPQSRQGTHRSKTYYHTIIITIIIILRVSRLPFRMFF